MNHPALAEDDGRIRVSVPEALQGEVLGRLNWLGGLITSVDVEANSRTVIGAAIPAERLGEFSDWLQQFSKGQGSITEDSP